MGTQTIISLLPLLLQYYFVGVALAFTTTYPVVGRTHLFAPPAAASAFASPHIFCIDKSIGSKRAADARIQCTKLSLSKGNDDDDQPADDAIDKSGYHEVNVAGVSVSPKGFLVILQSSQDYKKKNKKVAFPIQLTCAAPQSNDDSLPPSSSLPSTNTNNDTDGNNATKTTTARAIPSLFEENIDQTSVTTPEALTFLQLLNGVDMATPILGPDTLSLISVWYAFLLEEEKQPGQLGDGEQLGSAVGDENEVGERGGLLVEDELGLLSDNNNDATNTKIQSNKEAIDYIKAMVRTTLPPSPDGSDVLSYMDASPWQRARVQLPRVWLHGVRLQEVVTMDEKDESVDKDEDGGENGSDNAMSDIIESVPIQYILECSVDDGSRLLEIPLLAMPTTLSTSSIENSQSLTMKQQQLDISNEILQEISHTFNAETSASFISLALFHRYNKSGAGSADSPVLKVSEGLLNQLAELDAKKLMNESKEEGDCRYCWTASSKQDGEDDIDTVVRNYGLPFYRSLSQIQEEDQRVLQHLEEQNFGKKASKKDSSSGTSTSSNDNTASKDNVSSSGSSNQSSPPPPPPQQKAAALTMEQQALQQKLKSAWKIALQRNDTGALEKIQSAMEDLERQVMDNEKRGSILDDDNCREEDEEEDEEISSVEKIRRAMQQSSKRDVNDEEEEEGVPGLISELEEAAMSAELDEEKEEEQ